MTFPCRTVLPLYLGGDFQWLCIHVYWSSWILLKFWFIVRRGFHQLLIHFKWGGLHKTLGLRLQVLCSCFMLGVIPDKASICNPYLLYWHTTKDYPCKHMCIVSKRRERLTSNLGHSADLQCAMRWSYLHKLWQRSGSEESRSDSSSSFSVHIIASDAFSASFCLICRREEQMVQHLLKKMVDIFWQKKVPSKEKDTNPSWVMKVSCSPGDCNQLVHKNCRKRWLTSQYNGLHVNVDPPPPPPMQQILHISSEKR